MWQHHRCCFLILNLFAVKSACWLQQNTRFAYMSKQVSQNVKLKPSSAHCDRHVLQCSVCYISVSSMVCVHWVTINKETLSQVFFIIIISYWDLFSLHSSPYVILFTTWSDQRQGVRRRRRKRWLRWGKVDKEEEWEEKCTDMWTSRNKTNQDTMHNLIQRNKIKI